MPRQQKIKNWITYTIWKGKVKITYELSGNWNKLKTLLKKTGYHSYLIAHKSCGFVIRPSVSLYRFSAYIFSLQAYLFGAFMKN